MSGSIHIERALFVVGEQNTGKSTQLRSIFLDQRLGLNGEIPSSSNIRNAYSISNDRALYIRLTSPNEAGETLKEFLKKCAYEMQPNGCKARRWNFAGALQPAKSNKIGAAADVISSFAKRFAPERIRVAILAPDRFGNWIHQPDLAVLTAQCRQVTGTEVVAVDATDRVANGLFYADFFDFT